MENLFAKHTKYNVEQLSKNKAFMLSLIEQLKSFYYVYNSKLSEDRDVTKFSCTSRNGIINQLWISIGKDNKIVIKHGGILMYGEAQERRRAKLNEKYDCYGYMGSGITVEMKGITEENIAEFMPDIVYIMERNGFTPVK